LIADFGEEFEAVYVISISSRLLVVGTEITGDEEV